jgi:hypothetical protein
MVITSMLAMATEDLGVDLVIVSLLLVPSQLVHRIEETLNLFRCPGLLEALANALGSARLLGGGRCRRGRCVDLRFSVLLLSKDVLEFVLAGLRRRRNGASTLT